jgi:carbon-monoxide dehydrogenase medium subunit
VRLARRQALALPILNAGVMLSLSGGVIEWARIVMAPVGIRPLRAGQAESFLAGRRATAAVFQEAGALAAQEAEPRDSLLRGSRAYRLAVLPALIERALHESAREIAAKGGM